MTKENLKEYQWIKKNIEHLREQLEEAEAAACSQGISYDSIGSGSHDPDAMTENVALIIELKKRIEKELAKARRAQLRIDEAISELPEREKLLVRLKYIDGFSWEEVAVRMGYSWQHMHRIHSNLVHKLSLLKY